MRILGRMRIIDLPADRHDKVVELWRVSNLLAPWNDPYADIRMAMDNPTSTVLAGLDGNDIIASAMVGYEGHRGWVFYVAVDPGRRGRGLGEEIMDAAFDWLENLGAVKMQLLIRQGNEGVQAFYERIGFRVEPVMMMSKRIRPPANEL